MQRVYEGEKPQESSESTQVVDGEEMKVDSKYLQEVEGTVSSANPISNFTRVNPQTAAIDFSQSQTSMISTFVVGPQIGQPFVAGGDKPTISGHVDIFAPTVYLRDADGKLVKYKLFVYLGFKTMLVSLFKPDFEFTFRFVKQI